ncbi:helix-turn-helix domain-containing protein [Acidocella aquatica]|nr:XRE family transcriptional regulator [Acidocella aquatica]
MARRRPRVTVIRRALRMTQEQFSAEFGIPLGTLRDWEQERAEPDAPARAYLRAIAGNAEAVAKALKTHPAPAAE